jgi:hypothetical protein
MTRPPMDSRAGQKVLRFPGQTVNHSSEDQGYDTETHRVQSTPDHCLGRMLGASVVVHDGRDQ